MCKGPKGEIFLSPPPPCMCIIKDRVYFQINLEKNFSNLLCDDSN